METDNSGEQQVWGEKREMVSSTLEQLSVTALGSSGWSEPENHFPGQEHKLVILAVKVGEITQGKSMT